MQDEPRPDEILTRVANFLKGPAIRESSAQVSFLLRVSANAVEICQRQMTLTPQADAEELARLRALLGTDGDLMALNRELCLRIRSGELTLETPGLADHLWATTLAKLAVDQPTYSGYRAALAERANP
jgi:hypothetical protein